MKIPKKITWKYLFEYSYDKNISKEKESKESIIFRYDDKYFLSFTKCGSVKLFPYPDWWQNYIIISKNMPYEDMFYIIQQLKEIITPKIENLEKAVEQKQENQ